MAGEAPSHSVQLPAPLFTRQIMSDHIHHVPGALLNIEIITINNVDTIPAMMEKTFCLGQQTLNT